MTANTAFKHEPDALPLARAEQLVDDVSGLVSPPDVCVKVFELIRSPRSSARDIGEVIVRDPNLTARLLKVVNSSFYNFPQKIDSVSRAISIIGVRDLYSLVIAISAVKSFSKIASGLVNMDTFWRHSMFCALISRMLAKRCGILHPERLFVAGLLHDIGSLILFDRLPDAARDNLLLAGGDEQALYAAERKSFGFGHAELGALLLKAWQIPESLQAAVCWHHRPSAAGAARAEAAIVHLGDALANRSGIGGYFEDPAEDPAIDPSVWDAMGLKEETVDPEELIGHAGLEFAETAGFLVSGA